MPTLGQNETAAITPIIDLPPKLYDARRAELLARASMKTLVIFGYGSVLGAGTKSHGAMRYLTGWDSHEATSLLIITQHATTLLVGSPFMVPAAQDRLHNINIVDVPKVNWCTYLKDHTDGDLRSIGFDEMPMAIYRGLDANLDTSAIYTFDQQMAEIQLHKDSDTIELHKQGAVICDTLFESLGDKLHKGKTCWEI